MIKRDLKGRVIVTANFNNEVELFDLMNAVLLRMINLDYSERLSVGEALVIVEAILRTIKSDSIYLPENADTLFRKTHPNLNDNFIEQLPNEDQDADAILRVLTKVKRSRSKSYMKPHVQSTRVIFISNRAVLKSGKEALTNKSHCYPYNNQSGIISKGVYMAWLKNHNNKKTNRPLVNNNEKVAAIILKKFENAKGRYKGVIQRDEAVNKRNLGKKQKELIGHSKNPRKDNLHKHKRAVNDSAYGKNDQATWKGALSGVKASLEHMPQYKVAMQRIKNISTRYVI